ETGELLVEATAAGEAVARRRARDPVAVGDRHIDDRVGAVRPLGDRPGRHVRGDAAGKGAVVDNQEAVAAPVDGVVAGTGGDRVLAPRSDHKEIVAVTADQDVAATASGERVVPVVAGERVGS